MVNYPEFWEKFHLTEEDLVDYLGKSMVKQGTRYSFSSGAHLNDFIEAMIEYDYHLLSVGNDLKLYYYEIYKLRQLLDIESIGLRNEINN